MKHLFKILLFLLLPLYGSAAETNPSGYPFKTDLFLQKQGFTIGYSDRFRQALWVEYTLTAENLLGKQFRRQNRFKADPAVKKIRYTRGSTPAAVMIKDTLLPLPT